MICNIKKSKKNNGTIGGRFFFFKGGGGAHVQFYAWPCWREIDLVFNSNTQIIEHFL